MLGSPWIRGEAEDLEELGIGKEKAVFVETSILRTYDGPVLGEADAADDFGEIRLHSRSPSRGDAGHLIRVGDSVNTVSMFMEAVIAQFVLYVQERKLCSSSSRGSALLC